MTDFRPLHFKGGYPIWCADSLISQRHFAYHRSVFLDFHPLDCKIAPRRVVYQRTISANGKRQIPKSYESLGDANVSRNSLRGVSAKIPSQMNPLVNPALAGFFSVEIQASHWDRHIQMRPRGCRWASSQACVECGMYYHARDRPGASERLPSATARIGSTRVSTAAFSCALWASSQAGSVERVKADLVDANDRKVKNMARDAKLLRVTLDALRCTSSGSDPGDNLEIFGQLEARGVFLDGEGNPQPGFQATLWGQDERMSIAENTEIPVNKSVEFLVFERDFLWIGGRIMEHDTFGPNDVLGDGFRKIGYANIRNEMITVGFNEDGQEIVARYKIEVLRVEHHPEA